MGEAVLALVCLCVGESDLRSAFESDVPPVLKLNDSALSLLSSALRAVKKSGFARKNLQAAVTVGLQIPAATAYFFRQKSAPNSRMASDNTAASTVFIRRELRV